MMLFVAALLSINEEVIDAAMVDGANAWNIFWRIKFPLILPTVGIVSILTFVGNFNSFALIYTMQGSQGDPNLATDILGTFFFRVAFGAGGAAEPNYGMGTAIATMMFLIILVGVYPKVITDMTNATTVQFLEHMHLIKPVTPLPLDI